MELIFNPVVNFGEARRAQLAKSTIHSPHLHVGAPGKLPHLFTPSKTATLVPEFAVDDLPLGRTAALVPEFAVKDL